MEQFKLTTKELEKQGKDEFLLAIYEKAINKIELTEKEINKLSDYYQYFVDDEDGEDHRWFKFRYLVINLFDKYFSFYFQQGLTEHQENQYEEQKLTEVSRKEKQITISVWE